MLALAITLGLLAVPATHYLTAHQGFRKLLRAGSCGWHCPELSPTSHERAHRARARAWQVAAELAWLAYMVAAIAIPAAVLR